ncbi:MAG: TonB-dependent receptor [Prevotellaceae bacterium]|jgi:outer membrane receptor for ferrienterochelin and colicin|nr:TonB-dependent receptor [Prevotellaceae bacterium]
MRKIFLLCALLFGIGAKAANLSGAVLGATESGQDEPLVAADVFWLGSTGGAATDSDGKFEIPRSKKTNRLVIAYYGYAADTITIDNDDDNLEIRLKSGGSEIDEVTVQARQKGTFTSKIAPVTTEIISYTGLTKMACCNLAESFENSATVTVGFSDAVSGTRQIRMLGLAGIYTQILDESRPIMRGISATNGLNYTPGMWLEGIQISKGTSSVINGYEAITGQINLEYRKPNNPDRVFVNAYLNNDYRGEINLATTLQLSPKLSAILLLHASADRDMVDDNRDGFSDQPQSRQLNAANRWLYTFDNGMQLRTGMRFLVEGKQGGQLHFDRHADRHDTSRYGSYITNRNFNAYAKLGMPFGNDGRNSVALVVDYMLHDMASFFGQKIYNATEQSAYLNGLVQMGFGEHHSITFGLSARGDFYDEEYSFSDNITNPDYLLHENERVVGAFGEYTFNIDKKFSAIAGLRIDNNNLYGAFVTPRAHLKYNLTDNLIARASAGRGLRSANIIADNIWVMANQRNLVVEAKPKMEDAWTYGMSLTQYFNLHDEEKASIGVDVFRTQFSNQVIVDQEVGNNEIRVYNLDGKSYANNYQIDASVTPIERLSLYATFRYSDTQVELKEMGFSRKPLVDNFKGLLSVSYATKFNKWMFDATAQINGQSRLPSSRYVPRDAKFEYGEYSPVYPMFFAQVTKRWHSLDVYLGCENIADYTQDNPIIYADQPGNEKFNASVVWGPLMGRKFYLGIRWTL